jgi:hypothetical protein
MIKVQTDSAALKRFGIYMGLIALIVSCVFFLKCRYSSAIFSFLAFLLFFSAALLTPYLLKGLYIAWMHIAFILAWVNTKIILAVVFYIIFTPIGLLMKLLKFDLLERKKKQETYWKQKDRLFNPLYYERRF